MKIIAFVAKSIVGSLWLQQVVGGQSEESKGLRGANHIADHRVEGQTLASCVGDRNTFNASFGNCLTYVVGRRNHDFCASDKDSNGKSAAQTCSECLVCWDNLLHIPAAAYKVVTIMNPPEQSRTYSTSYNNDPGHKRSMINSAQAWSAGHQSPGDWMLIDLGKEAIIAGVVTQARNQYDLTRNGHQEPTGIRVEYSSDKSTYTTIQDFNITPFVDAAVITRSEFPTEVTARYIKITILAYINYPSMRAGIILSERNNEFQLLSEE